MLATLEELKARLEIAADDDSQDADLLVALGAASAKVLDMCRYVEADETGRVDTFTNVRQGDQVKLSKRTVVDDATFVVEGRGHGNEFQTLTADLLLPADGVFVVLAASAWWPPTSQLTPRNRRWREPVWPVVRVTYNVTGVGGEENAPDELREAAIALAIHWTNLHKAGGKKMVKLGPLSATISAEAVPASLRAILGSHYSGAGATWV